MKCSAPGADRPSRLDEIAQTMTLLDRTRFSKALPRRLFQDSRWDRTLAMAFQGPCSVE